MLMLLALVSTGLTYIRTDNTHLSTKLRIPAHKGCTRPAEVRAVDAQTGACGHIAHALVRARFALLGTVDASVYTRLVLMSHSETSFVGGYPQAFGLNMKFCHLVHVFCSPTMFTDFFLVTGVDHGLIVTRLQLTSFN